MSHGNMHSAVDLSKLRHAILKKNSNKRIDISFKHSVSMQIEGDKLRCIKPPPWPAPLLGPCGDAHNLGKYPSNWSPGTPQQQPHLDTPHSANKEMSKLYNFC